MHANPVEKNKINSIKMENDSANETTVAKVNGNVKNTVTIVQAQRKRMLLSEVYVHKVRKLANGVQSKPDDAATDDPDRFDVFHIFEFADDPTTKITPKLSTNCTEPGKIIDVLLNCTGSDTPQLQRLIDKLCAQSRWPAKCLFVNFVKLSDLYSM